MKNKPNVSKMSEAKFTKWKWKAHDDGYCMIGVLFRKGFGVLVGSKSKEVVANAHLIAAAPDMYEEIELDINDLVELLQTLDRNSDDYLFYEQKLNWKQSILAKARGEE
jgi:hypothetical protein